MSAKPWIVCYDISNNKNRNRALYRLRKLCDGRQKSVFECWFTEAELTELYEQLLPLIDEGDSFFCLPVSRSRSVIRLGQAESLLFSDMLLVA
ncbi:CRISPR-associated endonuclease Cas2 [Endozoicomonas montiporae]|uniref:CRISPR-associated endoribonuclease Cas2 n=1 Tax=Endozoicomonas montiporae CL-33 TaxID=570277 RepID=A0A142BBW5_9GAMM|nr:CRISPR-associated endonuclease Cas2 [Endozoicomonas montiporae]AMO56241.1 CRISPR-associated protein Cas2 [Endozoicomonas montiporae CL-33]